MGTKSPSRKEAKAIRLALANTQAEAGTAERSVRALSPQIAAAARRLSAARSERRRTRLQALALAGCTAVFLALAALGYQYRDFLLEKPERWGPALGFGVAVLVVVGCLPLLIRSLEGAN